jgi:Delta7-sterol 5-desaturase
MFEPEFPSAGHYGLVYLRTLLASWFVYYGSAGLWHLYVYRLSDWAQGFAKPNNDTIRAQIMLSQASMCFYAIVPVVSEWLIDSGWTLVYQRVDQVGWACYLAFTITYLAIVEFGAYWMHRFMHENKLLYTHLHQLHHKYNRPSQVSPWASLAFHPMDGILQSSPYVIALFLVPCHHLTHTLLMFFSGLWSVSIHDAVGRDTEPLMGSKYHLVHHSHYNYNFGQFFIFCDWCFGTLRLGTR